MMSTIGTGMAAGLAQTAHQSQEVSRAADKRRADATRQRDENQDRVDQLLHTGATSDADGELPDQQAPGYENLDRGDRQQPDPAEGPDTRPSETQGEPGGPSPLYSHLDVKA